MELQRVPKNTVTRLEVHICHRRNGKYLGVPQINSRWSPIALYWLQSYPQFHILIDSGLTSFWWLQTFTETHVSSLEEHHFQHSNSGKLCATHIVSRWSWFTAFNWKGKPTFQNVLKRRFPSAIGMWEEAWVCCLNWNGHRDALTPRKFG